MGDRSRYPPEERIENDVIDNTDPKRGWRSVVYDEAENRLHVVDEEPAEETPEPETVDEEPAEETPEPEMDGEEPAGAEEDSAETEESPPETGGDDEPVR